uniref:Uncharacterized protein n=1 Tax=Avena sativa TaxID=4498 RepID=A0ACD5VY69_AVESA
MEIESAKCECCVLREDCTADYIASVKAGFGGRWLCGLCSESVRDEEAKKGRSGACGSGSGSGSALEESVRDHMSFCGKFSRRNPAFRVADGMRQMLLRRRSSDIHTSSGAC